MQPRVKVGLLVGVIGLVVNVCMGGSISSSSLVVSLFAGALASYFVARQERPATKGAGAQAGAISGIIAGALIIIGEVIIAIGVLQFIQYAGISTAYGTIPPSSADAISQIIFYASGGVGIRTCAGAIVAEGIFTFPEAQFMCVAIMGVYFGVLATILSCLAGALTGNFVTSKQARQPGSNM